MTGRPQYTGRMLWRPLLLALALSGFAFAQQTITFRTRDGTLIYGDLYGGDLQRNSKKAVVLAHGGRFQKEGWRKQADELAAAGFRSLAIDYRGEGKSGAPNGSSDDPGRRFDVLGAIHYLHSNGASSVSIVGASMGGDYAIEAAEMEPDQIDRMVLLASGAYMPLVKFTGRKLFILARDDANTDGPRLPHIRAQFEKASEPKKLVILDGSEHAQFLFDTAQGPRLMREIIQFLSAP